MPCTTSVIRKACARFPGPVRRAVSPRRGVRGIRLRVFFGREIRWKIGVPTSPNIAPNLAVLLAIRIRQPSPEWNYRNYGGIRDGWFGLQHDPCGSLLKPIRTFSLRRDLGSGIIGWLARVICWLAGFIGWVAAAFAPARPPGLLAGRPRLFGKLLATSEEEIGHG